MKPDQYNPKAREAFGRSLIDVGVSIFKGIILLFTVVPLAAILKSAFDGGDNSVSILKMIGALSPEARIIILVLLAGGFLLGNLFRKEGLRHLHELEE